MSKKNERPDERNKINERDMESDVAEERATTQPNAGEVDLHEQLMKALAERDEYRELSMRKVAELENFRRRSEQERSELISYANQKLLLKLLPVLDDLHRAVESSKSSLDKNESPEFKALLDGVELVYNKTMNTFEESGVKRIAAIGEQFDINKHEALMQMPSEAPEGQILQEAQRGYMFGDKVLRYARVVISAGLPDAEAIVE